MSQAYRILGVSYLKRDPVEFRTVSIPIHKKDETGNLFNTRSRYECHSNGRAIVLNKLSG